jgi:hypothetical protein
MKMSFLGCGAVCGRYRVSGGPTVSCQTARCHVTEHSNLHNYLRDIKSLLEWKHTHRCTPARRFSFSHCRPSVMKHGKCHYISAWHANTKFHKNPLNCSRFGIHVLQSVTLVIGLCSPTFRRSSVFITVEYEGTRCCRNVGEHSTSHTAQHPSRHEQKPLSKSQISLCFFSFYKTSGSRGQVKGCRFINFVVNSWGMGGGGRKMNKEC